MDCCKKKDEQEESKKTIEQTKDEQIEQKSKSETTSESEPEPGEGEPKPEPKGARGLKSGIIAALLPHSGCIAFIIFAVVGATTATTLLKPLLLNPYFFYLLMAISVIFATLVAAVYLKKCGCASVPGIKKKWKYLLTLYGTVACTNLLFLMVIFPSVGVLMTSGAGASAPTGAAIGVVDTTNLASLVLKVAIPCSGHAPLIIGELKNLNGAYNIKYTPPNIFSLNYDLEKISKEQILALDVFKSYPATVEKESLSTNIQNTTSTTQNTWTCGCGGGSCGGGSRGCCGSR